METDLELITRLVEATKNRSLRWQVFSPNPPKRWAWQRVDQGKKVLLCFWDNGF